MADASTKPRDPRAHGYRRYWGSAQLPTDKASFFNAVTTPAPSGDGSTVATIRMYGPIDSWGGYWGISTKDVGAVLDALPDTVEQIVLRINSPGGEAFEALAILNMLRAHKASVTAVVDGMAASAGSFIAAGADETVMSPGTQMMIHSASTICWGNTAEMAKTAVFLAKLDASLIEIYEGKAGANDWAQMLADETWLTAAETVALGLADRVAVVPDTGAADTVGAEEDEVIVFIPVVDDEAEDSAPSIRIAAAARAAAASMLPATEPGDPNRKENVVEHDDFVAGMRQRLGVTDAALSLEGLLAALDEALAEQPTPPAAPATASLPDGVSVVDSAILEELRASAAAGVQALESQTAARRDGIITAALRDGRISRASKDGWRAALDRDESGTASLLESMPKNTIPVDELGHSDEPTDSADKLAAAAGWTTTEED